MSLLPASDLFMPGTPPKDKKIVMGCRVLDGENIGFEYGRSLYNVNRYAIEGLRKAVLHYTCQGMSVIIVTKRPDMQKIIMPAHATLFSADWANDVAVLKQAFHNHHSTFVTNDE